MTLRCVAKTLLALVLALPVAQVVLIWVRGLLDSMGDSTGGTLIGHVGSLCLGTWAVCLVGLVIVISLIVLNDGSREEQE